MEEFGINLPQGRKDILGQVGMKKSISLTLSDEELMELQRILLDEDREAALQFLKTHLDKKIKAVISGEGH